VWAKLEQNFGSNQNSEERQTKKEKRQIQSWEGGPVVVTFRHALGGYKFRKLEAPNHIILHFKLLPAKSRDHLFLPAVACLSVSRVCFHRAVFGQSS
jgi:hypothetical protein